MSRTSSVLSVCLSVCLILLLFLTPDICQARVCEFGGCPLVIDPNPGGGVKITWCFDISPGCGDVKFDIYRRCCTEYDDWVRIAVEYYGEPEECEDPWGDFICMTYVDSSAAGCVAGYQYKVVMLCPEDCPATGTSVKQSNCP